MGIGDGHFGERWTAAGDIRQLNDIRQPSGHYKAGWTLDTQTVDSDIDPSSVSEGPQTIAERNSTVRGQQCITILTEHHWW